MVISGLVAIHNKNGKGLLRSTDNAAEYENGSRNPQ